MSRIFKKLPAIGAFVLVVGALGGPALAVDQPDGMDVPDLAAADKVLLNYLQTGDTKAASYDPASLGEANDRIWQTIAEIIADMESLSLTPGPAGPAGADGLPGADGADGAVGPPGPAGADGLDADPAVTDALDARITALEAALAAHEANVSNPHSVTKDQVGLSNVPNTKMNLTATISPGPSDDADDGYSVGSVWINTAVGSVAVLVDATPGSAEWRLITNDNQQIICDPFVFEHITVDTTVYVPSTCFGDFLIIEDGLFIGQRRTVTTAGPGFVEGPLRLDPVTEPGGQSRDLFLRSTGDTVIWEWGPSGWVVVFDTTT